MAGKNSHWGPGARFDLDTPQQGTQQGVSRRDLLKLTTALGVSSALGACSNPQTPEQQQRREAQATLTEAPKSAIKGTEIQYEIQYIPGLDPSVVPSVSLLGAPVGVVVKNQIYDPKTGKVRVTVGIPPNITDTVLRFSFDSRAQAYNIPSVPVVTDLIDSRGPELSKDSNTTASVKQGATTIYSLQFDKTITSATLDGLALPEGSVINGSNISLKVSASSQVSSTQPELVVKDISGNATTVKLTLNTIDGIGPEWMNANDFPTTLTQLEEKEVKMIFGEPLSVVPSISAGFAVLESALSPDGKVLTMKIRGRSDVGEYTGVLIATDANGNNKQYEFSTNIVDKTPPALTLQSAPGSVTRETKGDFIVASNEEIVKLEYSTDGGISWFQSALPDAIRLTGLSDGTQRISIRGTDKYGNVSTELTHTWMVDTKAPVLLKGSTILKRVQGDATFTKQGLNFESSVGIAAWAQTSGSGITLGAVNIADTKDANGNVIVTNGTVMYDVSFDSSTVPGTYILNISVKDTVGNETIVPITLMVDKKNTEAIAGSITGPETLYSIDTAKEYSVTPVDPDGMSSVTAEFDGVSMPVTLTSGTYSISTPTGLAVGTHTLTFTVIGKKPDGTDEAPKSVTKPINVVEVDTTPPSVSSPLVSNAIDDGTGNLVIDQNYVLTGTLPMSENIKTGTYAVVVKTETDGKLYNIGNVISGDGSRSMTLNTGASIGSLIGTGYSGPFTLWFQPEDLSGNKPAQMIDMKIVLLIP